MISVCMATYNGERFIKDQIASILPQLSEIDELIISDDESTDRTLEIIESFNDSRIKVLHHKHNPNYEKIKHSRSFYYATDNFENALKEAKGDYIFLSDQDDVWAGNKVQKIMEELQNFDLVMSNFSIIDENNKITKEKFYKSSISLSRLKNILRSKYIGCCIAFTRELLNKALPFPPNLIAHDYWIGCLSKNATFIDKPLHIYRRTKDNVSTSTQKSNNSFFYKIKYRIEFCILLFQRLYKYRGDKKKC